MKILVIGACGFIGSNAVKYFRAAGHHVTACDIIVPAADPDFILLDKPETGFDILFKKRSYDVCINASGSATVGISFTNPAHDYLLNTHNVFRILDSIRQLNPDCKFINFSSAAVYGNPDKLPVTEKQNCSPISPYGFHKLMSENICAEFFSVYGVPSVSLRVFSAYGCGLKKQLFWDLYQKTKNSETVELFGTGNETRDFIFIDDLLGAVDIIMSKGNFNGGVINVSSGVETGISDAARIFLSLVNEKLSLKFNNIQKQGDPLNWRADISKLRLLGFTSKTTMADGLNQYFVWLKKQAL